MNDKSGRAFNALLLIKQFRNREVRATLRANWTVKISSSTAAFRRLSIVQCLTHERKIPNTIGLPTLGEEISHFYCIANSSMKCTMMLLGIHKLSGTFLARSAKLELHYKVENSSGVCI